MKETLGIVVNYYCNDNFGPARDILVDATTLSLRLLRSNNDIRDIILVNGSNVPDKKLEEICKNIDVIYYQTSKIIGYAEAYNIGWKKLENKYIGLMANDIVPNPPSTISILLDAIKIPDVGCAFPYMETPRFDHVEVQKTSYFNRHNITCEPSSMTLNLNLFKRETLESIGGITEKYKFGFSEPILINQIRSLNQRCLLVGGARVYHYDQLTKLLGASSLEGKDWAEDWNRFRSEYPDFASERGIAALNFSASPLSVNRRARFLWTLAYKYPSSRVRARLFKWIMWAEPWLTRYKGEGLGSIRKPDPN